MSAFSSFHARSRATAGLNKQTAGLLTQSEAGTIAEIATEEAFQRGLHVWGTRR